MSDELGGNSLLLAKYLYLNNEEIEHFFKLYYDIKSKYTIVTPTNIIRGISGTNPVNLALGSIYKEFTSSQFVWYVLSILFFPPEYTLKLLLSSFQITPFSPIPYASFQAFVTKIHSPVSIDVIMMDVFQRNKTFLEFEDIVEIYTKMPKTFQQFTFLQTEIRHMVGEEICRRIDYRRKNIRVIQDYYLKNNKYPSESCCELLKRIFYRLPPLYQYDHSLPQDKVESTFEYVIRFNCAQYYSKVSIIPRNVKNSLDTSYTRPSFKEKPSDASKPKCNRSVRSSLKNTEHHESCSSFNMIVSDNPKSK